MQRWGANASGVRMQKGAVGSQRLQDKVRSKRKGPGFRATQKDGKSRPKAIEFYHPCGGIS